MVGLFSLHLYVVWRSQGSTLADRIQS